MDHCIFCGEAFGLQRPRSNEHAAPKWCGELLPDGGKAQHNRIEETSDGRIVEDHGFRNPFTTVAGDVCKPCNEGWMHELEDSCKDIVGHLIQGHPRKIRYWRQTLVATWAVKTALVWECVSPENRTIPLDVLRMFHEAQRPGARQQVWIGRFNDSQNEPHSFQRTAAYVVGKPRPDKPGQAHAYMAALSVGELAFVVCGHLLNQPLPFARAAQFTEHLTPIWRPSLEATAWPPPKGLDRAGLQACVHTLGQPIDTHTQTPET
jgi:hypothetical protein